MQTTITNWFNFSISQSTTPLVKHRSSPSNFLRTIQSIISKSKGFLSTLIHNEKCPRNNVTEILQKLLDKLKGKLNKYKHKVRCPSEYLSLPVCLDNDRSILRMLKVRSCINHSGTINTGHCWAFIRGLDNSFQLKCSDKSVTKASFKDLSN